MSDSEQIKSYKPGKLSDVQKLYQQKQEKTTQAYGTKYFNIRHARMRSGLFWVLVVASIYGFTVTRVKQETFLDHLDDDSDY